LVVKYLFRVFDDHSSFVDTFVFRFFSSPNPARMEPSPRHLHLLNTHDSKVEESSTGAIQLSTAQPPLVLALDIGTSSIRAAIHDAATRPSQA
jgi:hypothetical protein